MTVKTNNMRLENLGEAVSWLVQEEGEATFTHNSIVIRCKGFSDYCDLSIISHEPERALYIAIQRVYTKVRDTKLPDTSRTGLKGKGINVTGKATRASFVVRSPKPKET